MEKVIDDVVGTVDVGFSDLQNLGMHRYYRVFSLKMSMERVTNVISLDNRLLQRAGVMERVRGVRRVV